LFEVLLIRMKIGILEDDFMLLREVFDACIFIDGIAL
jgi:hypothetical protein